MDEPTQRTRPLEAQWGGLIARILAAVAGGYALANLVAITLGIVLPGTQLNAFYTGLLLSFAVFAAAVVWVFAAATARRAWIGLAMAAAPCLAVIGAAQVLGGG